MTTSTGRVGPGPSVCMLTANEQGSKLDPRQPQERTLEHRSAAWFRDAGKNGFLARSHLSAMGVSTHALRKGPVIGICTSWSELTPCNAHLGTLADGVRRGVTAAGGIALEFPTMSLGETLMRPSTMLFRNLMAMEVEETIRANPLDAVVLLSGCDKTVPAQVMGAASVDLPSILITGGPMLTGRFRGREVGSGTDVWRAIEARRAGEMTDDDIEELESCLNRSAGHCMTMGTASTMACLTEALGLQLAGTATLPAPDSRRRHAAEDAGRRVVELAREGGPRPSEVLGPAAFRNALRVNAAIGGSTNAILHLLAISARVGVPLSLDDVDRYGSEVPLLVDLQPSGTRLMEDFAHAGGVPAVQERLKSVLETDVLSVDSSTLAEVIADAECHDASVIRGLDDPVQPAGHGTVVLRGNLAPGGAVLKVSASSPQLRQHRGPALVFDQLEDYLAVIDDVDLPVTTDTVLVVRNSGPKGYPGMPEIANLPLPGKLLRQGVTDLVRICDGRMSGTAYGTVVLHVTPESYVGGPLAVLETGDLVEVDVLGRGLNIVVDDDVLAARLAAWQAPESDAGRGWTWLYREHVLQADQGADMDFLVGRSGHDVPRAPF